MILPISSFFIVVLVFNTPTFTTGQNDHNITTISSRIIPTDPEDNGQCPSNEQIQKSLSSIKLQVQKELEKLLPIVECGDPSVWRQVAFINMSDETQSCPSGLELAVHDSLRGCGRSGETLCSSTLFPVSGGAYNQVCGRIRGYQYGETNAFYSATILSRNTIDEQYLDGVSLTYRDEDEKREHIWSFAAGRTEHSNPPTLNTYYICPCDLSENEPNQHQLPSFIGEDYFCESAANDDYHEDTEPAIFPNDPLWDGRDCRPESRCCRFNSPPYFTKELPASTTEDIELRICLGGGTKEIDLPLDLIELYVQ